MREPSLLINRDSCEPVRWFKFIKPPGNLKCEIRHQFGSTHSLSYLMIYYLLSVSRAQTTPSNQQSNYVSIYTYMTFPRLSNISFAVSASLSGTVSCTSGIVGYTYIGNTTEFTIDCKIQPSRVIFNVQINLQISHVNYFYVLIQHPAFQTGFIRCNVGLSSTVLSSIFVTAKISRPQLFLFIAGLTYIQQAGNYEILGVKSAQWDSSFLNLTIPAKMQFPSFLVAYITVERNKLLGQYENLDPFYYSNSNFSVLSVSLNFQTTIGGFYYFKNNRTTGRQPVVRNFNGDKLSFNTWDNSIIIQGYGNLFTFLQYKCLNQYLLIDNNACLQSCPLRYYTLRSFCLQCGQLCSVCTDQTQCTTCISFGLLAAGQCSCIGSYRKGNWCVGCQYGCTDCSQIACLYCDPNFKLTGGSCIIQCQPATVSPDNQKCLNCSEHCLTCTVLLCLACDCRVSRFQAGKCMAIDTELFFYHGRCYTMQTGQVQVSIQYVRVCFSSEAVASQVATVGGVLVEQSVKQQLSSNCINMCPPEEPGLHSIAYKIARLYLEKTRVAISELQGHSYLLYKGRHISPTFNCSQEYQFVECTLDCKNKIRKFRQAQFALQFKGTDTTFTLNLTNSSVRFSFRVGSNAGPSQIVLKLDSVQSVQFQDNKGDQCRRRTLLKKTTFSSSLQIQTLTAGQTRFIKGISSLARQSSYGMNLVISCVGLLGLLNAVQEVFAMLNYLYLVNSLSYSLPYNYYKFQLGLFETENFLVPQNITDQLRESLSTAFPIKLIQTIVIFIPLLAAALLTNLIRLVKQAFLRKKVKASSFLGDYFENSSLVSRHFSASIDPLNSVQNSVIIFWHFSTVLYYIRRWRNNVHNKKRNKAVSSAADSLISFWLGLLSTLGSRNIFLGASLLAFSIRLAIAIKFRNKQQVVRGSLYLFFVVLLLGVQMINPGAAYLSIGWVIISIVCSIMGVNTFKIIYRSVLLAKQLQNVLQEMLRRRNTIRIKCRRRKIRSN